MFGRRQACAFRLGSAPLTGRPPGPRNCSASKMNNSLNMRCSSAISTVSYASTNASANDGGTQLPFLIGTPELHAQRQFDRRDKDQILTYEPTAGWTKPPARAWIPELNRDVLVGCILWNAVVAILARFTGMCGVPPPDAPSYVLCGDSDEWVMGEVAVYNTLGVGMFSPPYLPCTRGIWTILGRPQGMGQSARVLP